MKTRQLLTTLTLGLGLTLAVGLFAFIGRAAPGNPIPDPPRNSHTAPLTTTVSITYDEPISAATVTSRTFAVHGMQSGLVTATRGVSGGRIIVTPTRPFHQGELVYAIATTGTLGLDSMEPLSSTQWQFNAGRVATRCIAGFTDTEAELTGVFRSSTAWGDYDNDGDLDILLTGLDNSWNCISRVYRNDGPSTGWAFTDTGDGLADVAYGSVAWGDYDNDGDLDILLTGVDDSWNYVSRIYRNDGGSFTDTGAGLTDVGYGSVAWGDYDNDGDLDILLTGSDSTWNPVSRVYRNDGPSSGWAFTDIGAGLTDVGYGSVAWGDYDNDGDLDILLAGSAYTGPVSHIYRNDGSSFTDIDAGLPGVYLSSAAWGDYDNDGDLDILLMGSTQAGPVSRIYRNDDGSFTDIEAGLTRVMYSSAAWGDYDNDGDLDILLTGEDSDENRMSRLYRNDDGSFTDVGVQLTDVSGSSVAWGDYDNDGDLDILLTGSGVSQIYRNDDCAPDLALVKTVTPRVAVPGDPITYTLTFSNSGILIATQVVITDVMPSFVVTTSVVHSGAAITDTGFSPSYVWQVQDLAPGEGGVITITGMLSADSPPGFFDNTATITTSADSNPSNNRSSAWLYVDAYVWCVTATVPTANAVSVPLTATVAATFDGDLDAGTATSAAFVAHGMMSGLVTGTLGYDGPGRTLTLTPGRPFHAGETARIIATDNLLRTDGEPLLPYQWQFTAGQIATRCVAGFTDVGAELQDVTAGSVVWGDYDGDGDLDILLTGAMWDHDWTPVTRIYRNDGPSTKWTFTVVEAGLTDVYDGSAAWGDYDNDGDLDILLTGDTGVGLDQVPVSRIYRNDKGSFTNIGAKLVAVMYSSAAWGDYDNDGDLDILLVGWNNNSRTSRVYRNDGGSFRDIGAGLIDVSGSAAWGDYDNDGDLDILLAGYTGDDYVSIIYRNDASNFTDIGAGLMGISDSAAWGDYDNDGDLDILLTGSTEDNGMTQIYRNDNGNFTNIGAGLTGVYASSAAWGDYDNDGDLDILLAGWGHQGCASRIYRNDAGSFTDIGASLVDVVESSVAWGDYDSDGDLDTLLTGWAEDIGAISLLYRNDDCSPDLELAKTVAPRFAAPGESITYTLTFSNSGVLTATHVVITDIVPVSVTVSNVASSGAVITDTGFNPPYVWQVQDLTPGESGVITITGILSSDLSAGSFDNIATITTLMEDIYLGNNSSSAMLHVHTWHVTATVPTANAVGVPLTATVAAAFDGDLDTSTATSATFAVHGMMSGLVTGTLDYDGPNRTLTLTSSRPFHAGETVRATATDSLLRSDGDLLFPYQWQFTAGQVRSRCFGGFTDIDPGMIGVTDSSVAWGDYDNDGDLDILLTGEIGIAGQYVSLIYRNDGPSAEWMFTETGIDLTGVYNGSVAWGDYDNDGDLDVLLAGNTGDYPDWNPVSQVYRNDAGSFTNIDADLVGIGDGSVAWGDYDNDGDLDILLTGVDNSDVDVSRIYRNDAGNFTDINAGLMGVYGSSVAWGDYDNDGDLDILLTGVGGDDGYAPMSLVYRNDGDDSSEGWIFTDIQTELLGVSSGSVAWGDYDNDGDLDILLAGYEWDLGPVSRIYRNDGDTPSGGWTFTDIDAGLAGVYDSSVAWGDYDNDGDLDILLTTDVSLVYRNDGDDPSGGWTFTNIGAGATDSAAWGDYDNDGNLDILFLSEYGTPLLYRNEDCAAEFVDLAITKSVVPQIAAPNGPITYTLTFSNTGSANATGVVVADTMPVSVIVNHVISSGVSITETSTGPFYVWQVQDLAPGERGAITITGVLSDSLPADIFTNTAVIATMAMDDDLSNNQDNAAITVIAEADLEISKEVNDSTPNEGDTIVYTITITNNGPHNASDVVVSDTLPSGVSYVSDDGDGDYDDDIGVWSVGNLEIGVSATLHITATVDAGTAGDTITNTAVIIASDQSDPIADNNQADATITVTETGGDWYIYLPLVVRNQAP